MSIIIKSIALFTIIIIVIIIRIRIMILSGLVKSEVY